MQHPTCVNVRIRSTQDAHKIFYAVQQELLPMITRRLDADERLALRSGCIYAWEERGPHSEITGLGIERFTEGRRWSPSRVRDEFLFYYEKYLAPPESSNQLGATERQPPRDWDPLVKQTYSVWVETQNGRRKWHLTAYFTQATIDQLGTIDDIETVKDLLVPEGLFKSTRLKHRCKSDDRLGETSKPSSSVTRTYAPFPSPYPSSSQNQSEVQLRPVAVHEHFQNSPSMSPPNQTIQYLSPSIPEHGAAMPYRSCHDEEVTVHQLQPTQIASRYRDHELSFSPHPNHQINYFPDMTILPSRSLSDPPIHGFGRLGQPSPSASELSNSPLQDPTDVVNLSRPAAIETKTPFYKETETISPPQSSLSGYTYPTLTTLNGVTDHIVPEPDMSYQPVLPRSHSHISRIPGHRTRGLPNLQTSDAMISMQELSPTDSYGSDSSRRGSIGPSRDLAPLYELTRPQPYRREPSDDKALRLLKPRSS